MQIYKLLILTTISLFFIACGESTQKPLKDVKSLAINESDTSIYSTDAAVALSATLTYSDNSTVDATNFISWNSSDETIVTSSDGATLSGSANGGDANLTVSYNSGLISDPINIHVIALTDFNITLTDADANTTGEYKIVPMGIFEDNTTRAVVNNTTWDLNNSATITQEDDNSFTLSIIATGETNITLTLFDDENFTKTLIYEAD